MQIEFGSLINREFFERSVDEVAFSLVGCGLFTEIDGQRVGGRIVETEAYCQNDPTAHCFNKASPGQPYENSVMCKPMYGAPGSIYVYPNSEKWCCLNLVARSPEQNGKFGSAVLIRAIEPTENLDCMRARRKSCGVSDNALKRDRSLCSGPMRLCQALAITYKNFNERHSDEVFRFCHGNRALNTPVHCDRRIGVPNAWPRRYLLPTSPFLSKKAIDSRECTQEWLTEVAALRTPDDMEAFFKMNTRV